MAGVKKAELKKCREEVQEIIERTDAQVKALNEEITQLKAFIRIASPLNWIKDRGANAALAWEDKRDLILKEGE